MADWDCENCEGSGYVEIYHGAGVDEHVTGPCPYCTGPAPRV